MIKNPKLFLFFATVSFFILMNSFLLAETNSVQDTTDKNSVCILSFDTEYKKTLISALVQEFKAKQLTVTTDNISNRQNYNPANYGAVILLSAVEKFNPTPEAVEYITNNNYSSNIVYFATYSLLNFPYGPMDKNKIDAISSASVANDKKVFDDTKNKIVEKTLKAMGKE